MNLTNLWRRISPLAFLGLGLVAIAGALYYVPRSAQSQVVVSNGDLMSISDAWDNPRVFLEGGDIKFKFDEHNSTILFGKGWEGSTPESEITGGTELWKVQKDGTGLEKVSGDARVLEAFAGNNAVFYVDTKRDLHKKEGSTNSVIASKVLGSEISTDGRAVVYVKLNDDWQEHDYFDKAQGLRVLDLATGKESVVTTSAGDFAPLISPDGARVLFYGPNEKGLSSLFSVMRDGSGRKQLTNFGEAFLKDGITVDTPSERPVFSPNGKRMAYHSDFRVWVVEFNNEYTEVKNAKILAHGKDPVWISDNELTVVVGDAKPQLVHISVN